MKSKKKVNKKISNQIIIYFVVGTLLIFSYLISGFYLVTKANLIDSSSSKDKCNNTVCEECPVNRTMATMMNEESRENIAQLFDQKIQNKYLGTYLVDDEYGYNHSITLKTKQQAEMTIVFTEEGPGKIVGKYFVIEEDDVTKIVFYTQPYQYFGWSGDYKWRRLFIVDENKNLVFKEEVKKEEVINMGIDMIDPETIFIKK
jgi:hypothetical protein